MLDKQKEKQIVVIGAGPAGLTAAYELLRQGNCHVTVLEASNEVGGISRTVRYHGNRMDIGGHRFFTQDNRVMQWWTSLMPLQSYPAADDRMLQRPLVLQPGGPDPETSDDVMLLRHRVSRIYSLRRFFDYPISLSWATLHNLGMVRTVKASASYMRSLLHKLPESSLENFYINRFGRVLYQLFFEDYTEKVWGLHPSQISAAWGAQRVKGLSGRAILRDMLRKATGRKPSVIEDGQKPVETSLIEQFLYPKFGPGQLWEAVARRIREMGGEIKLNARVENLVAEHGRVRSLLWTDANVEAVSGEPSSISEKQEVFADYFLSSMPLRDLTAGLRGLDIPEAVQAIAAGLPYRDFITVGLLVDHLAITNRSRQPTPNNLIPDCWIYIQEPGVRLGRLQIFNNWSPYLVAAPLQTVWLGLEYFCQEGDELWTMDDASFCAMAVDELEKIGMIRQDAVLDACRIKVPKAYPSYFGTYDKIEELASYLNGFANLYCIGRNGQHRYNNMDHSMLTAMLAVDQILQGTGDKADLWHVNTEQAYHEKRQAD